MADGDEGSQFNAGLIRGIVAGALVAVTLVGSAAVFFTRYRVALLKRGWNMKSAVVAARDVGAGATLTANDLTTQMFPEQFADGAFSDVAASTLAGKATRVALGSGDLVTKGALDPLSPAEACWLAADMAVTSSQSEKKPAAKALWAAVRGKYGERPYPYKAVER